MSNKTFAWQRIAFKLVLLAAVLGVFISTASSARAQTYSVLYSFSGQPDGANPGAALVGDSAGNLYGTTDFGGAYHLGTVFKLDASGNERVLYSFKGTPDGQEPYAGLVRDPAGNLYGTTPFGGAYGWGAVFKLDAAGNETVLHSFKGQGGFYPSGALVRDPAGNLYGTTVLGGALQHGTVFELDAAGSETVLHSFKGQEGVHPSGALVRDPAGNLYGTTLEGGDRSCNNPLGCGVVFKLDAAGNETVLHSFKGTPDGAQPEAGLVRDPAGNLYGITWNGGLYDQGTVFKITPP
jgi:uncharacterized repeat protein (TIGR03803 family)